MNQALRESISALMDGEASEFELHQVLKASDKSEVRETWAAMHTTRTVMHRQSPVLCPPSVTASLLEALEQEPAHRSNKVSAALPRIAASFAVAASVTVATFVGLSGPATLSTTESQQAAPASQQLANARVYEPGQLRGVSYRAAYGSGPQSVGSKLDQAGELSPAALAARERLAMYLQRHVEYASLNSSKGMMPFARTVIVQDSEQ